MSVRPFQYLGEGFRIDERKTNIHLWVVKDCDGCDYQQRFAAGCATNMKNVREKMQSEWYCRSCRRSREDLQRSLGEVVA